MLLEGKITLQGNIQKLWDSLLEPKIMAVCFPGMESLELKENNVYNGVVKQKVGPFSIRAKVTVKLIELNPPNHLKGTVNGELLGGMGIINGDAVVDFKEIKKDEVELTYTVNANITGKVAVLGDRVMRVKAKSMEAEMAKNFQEKLLS